MWTTKLRFQQTDVLRRYGSTHHRPKAFCGLGEASEAPGHVAWPAGAGGACRRDSLRWVVKNKSRNF